jgi:hypothetical protein
VALLRLKGIEMTVKIANGATVYIASGYGASKTMSALTNAATAVATFEGGHGVAEGDFIEVTSGWSRLTNKIVRAGGVATNDVDLDEINTASTTTYPIGSGIGTVREITGWTQLTQILESGSNGGEQQFLEYQFLEADAQVRIPTFKSAAGLTFSIADDPTLAGYILASTANDDRAQRAVKIVLANSSIITYNCYISLNKTPSLTVNNLMACQVTLSMLNEPVRYAS